MEDIICLFCGKKFIDRKCNKRKFCSLSCSSKSGNFGANDKHDGWKGDKVGYSGIHWWVRKNFGEQPNPCEGCGVSGGFNKNTRWNLEYANISGEYKRDREDWKILCRKCHSKFDFSKIVEIETVCITCDVKFLSKKRFCKKYCSDCRKIRDRISAINSKRRKRSSCLPQIVI